MSEVTAYEKMLKDGTAFKKIDMNQIAAQQYAQADINAIGGERETPLGEPIKENSNLEDDYTDWSQLDNAMEKRVQSLKNKMNDGTSIKKVGKLMTPSQKEIELLKKRVSRLEEALMAVMEVHEQLFE